MCGHYWRLLLPPRHVEDGHPLASRGQAQGPLVPDRRGLATAQLGDPLDLSWRSLARQEPNLLPQLAQRPRVQREVLEGEEGWQGEGSALYSRQCAVFSVQCAVCSVQCAAHSV